MNVKQTLSRADLIDMHKARVEDCIEEYRKAVMAYAEFRHELHMKHSKPERGYGC